MAPNTQDSHLGYFCFICGQWEEVEMRRPSLSTVYLMNRHISTSSLSNSACSYWLKSAKEKKSQAVDPEQQLLQSKSLLVIPKLQRCSAHRESHHYGDCSLVVACRITTPVFHLQPKQKEYILKAGVTATIVSLINNLLFHFISQQDDSGSIKPITDTGFGLWWQHACNVFMCTIT